MKRLTSMIVAMLFLFAGALVFAQGPGMTSKEKPKNNGGFVFLQPKSQSELLKEEDARRAEAARKKTEEMNKQWKAHLKREQKAKDNTKKEAEKKKKKAAKEARKIKGK